MTQDLKNKESRNTPESLILRHFHYQNKHRRGNLKQVGTTLLRYFYNSSDGKIDYQALIKCNISHRQAEKFISIMRKDGWLLDNKRGYAPINYPKIIALEAELKKQGFLWGFRAADNDVIWRFRKQAHAACLSKDKKDQAAKIWQYTNEEIRLKILSMIGKGYDVVFQSLEHFINYMAKFLEFELNTKKFLEWTVKKIKEMGGQVNVLVNKTPCALQAFLKTLNYTVSYIDKIKKALVSNIRGLSIEEEKKISKNTRAKNQKIDLLSYLTTPVCNTIAWKWNYKGFKWNGHVGAHGAGLDAVAIRGLAKHLIQKREDEGKTPLVFYSGKAIEKYMTISLEKEKCPIWQLQKYNEAELKNWHYRVTAEEHAENKPELHPRNAKKDLGSRISKEKSITLNDDKNEVVNYLIDGGEPEKGSGCNSMAALLSKFMAV